MVRRSARVRFVSSIPLIGSVVLATVAACGPAEGPKPVAPVATPSASASATSVPTTSPSTSSTVPPPPVADAGAPAPATAVPMKPIAASAMEERLREIGLNPAALQPLNKLDPKTLRDVMNTFTKALGVQCKYCHEKDFKAPTPMKKIATHMWNDFTRGLTTESGGAVYCDSCHTGRTQLLDRRDLKALGGWMQENYVDKLKRADKKDHSCETCHGDPFEGKILTKLWK